ALGIEFRQTHGVVVVKRGGPGLERNVRLRRGAGPLVASKVFGRTIRNLGEVCNHWKSPNAFFTSRSAEIHSAVFQSRRRLERSCRLSPDRAYNTRGIRGWSRDLGCGQGRLDRYRCDKYTNEWATHVRTPVWN